MAPNPISPYGVSKLAAEQYMQAFHRTYGMETVCLRYFNIFGPGQDAHSEYSAVWAKFIAQMLKGESPTIYGDGEQTRDFNFIDKLRGRNLLACKADTRGQRKSLQRCLRQTDSLMRHSISCKGSSASLVMCIQGRTHRRYQALTGRYQPDPHSNGIRT